MLVLVIQILFVEYLFVIVSPYRLYLFVLRLNDYCERENLQETLVLNLNLVVTSSIIGDNHQLYETKAWQS